MTSFSQTSHHPRGLLKTLLTTSYAPLLTTYPNLPTDWKTLESTALTFPDSFFITSVDDTVVGFASINASDPNHIEVGQNVILPEFQGKGYGTAQIEEVQRRVQSWGYSELWVSTGDIPFFAPAIAMYEKCGFEVVERKAGELFGVVVMRWGI